MSKYTYSNRKSPIVDGEECINCGGPVVENSRNGVPPKERNACGYYFERWFTCKDCRIIYRNESDKRSYTDATPLVFKKKRRRSSKPYHVEPSDEYKQFEKDCRAQIGDVPW